MKNKFICILLTAIYMFIFENQSSKATQHQKINRLPVNTINPNFKPINKFIENVIHPTRKKQNKLRVLERIRNYYLPTSPLVNDITYIKSNRKINTDYNPKEAEDNNPSAILNYSFLNLHLENTSKNTNTYTPTPIENTPMSISNLLSLTSDENICTSSHYLNLNSSFNNKETSNYSKPILDKKSKKNK